MAERSTSRTRRSFLLTLGVGAAGAAAAVGKGKALAKTEGISASSTARPGYRRTKHVGNYYRTAKH